MLSRRKLLAAAGVGAATVTLLPTTSGRTDEEARVFIHPNGDRLGPIDDLLETLGGTIDFEYDHFDFVAATIPSSTREELEDDEHVALVEDDPAITFLSSSVTNDLVDDDPPNGDDDGVLDDDPIGIGDDDSGESGDLSCSTHPLQSPAWGYDRIGAEDVDASGDGVDLAILDTGIESSHCDLEVAGGQNFTAVGSPGDYEDRHGHGTHCAGIAGALDHDIGVLGVAPEASLYAVKVLDDNGRGHHSTMAAGIDWCLSHDIEVLSMSFGSESGSAAMDTAIEAATDAGHLLVGSAGNEGNDGADGCGANNVTYPATHDDVVCVSAMDEDDSLAEYSSVGEEIDLLAPGSRIESTTIDNEYSVKSGTSMACPYVAGVAALVWERRDESGPGPNDAVRDRLENTAETVLESCAEGHGLVDAAAAVESADEGSDAGDDDAGEGDDESGGDDADTGTGGDDSTAGGDETNDGDGAGGGTGDDSIDDALSLLDRIVTALRRFFDWVLGLF